MKKAYFNKLEKKNMSNRMFTEIQISVIYIFSKIYLSNRTNKKEKHVISIHIYIQIKSVNIFYFNLVWLNIINHAQNSKRKTMIKRFADHSQ